MLHDLYQELPTADLALAPVRASCPGSSLCATPYMLCMCVRWVSVWMRLHQLLPAGRAWRGNFWQCKTTTGHSRTRSRFSCGECTSVSGVACKRICIGLSPRERGAEKVLYSLISVSLGLVVLPPSVMWYQNFSLLRVPLCKNDLWALCRIYLFFAQHPRRRLTPQRT